MIKAKRSVRLLLVYISLATMFAGCFATRQGKDSFFFIQMSDPQFGFFTENRSFEKETVNFTRAIDEANRLKPAFVIVTGDLVNKPFDRSQIDEYLRISAGLDKHILLFNVPGNHDVGNEPGPSDIIAYNANFGKDYYSFEKGKMLGIVLNSLYLHKPEKVREKAVEQEKWLIKLLARSQKKKYNHKVIFLHHPLFLETAEETNDYFNIPIETRKKYLELFKTNGIRYVFAGHYHRNSIGNTPDIEMITTGPVGRPLGKDSSGFRVVEVNKHSITHKYYPLDSIP